MQLSLAQVEALAPDAGTLARAKKLAKPQRFSRIGADDRALWAQVQGTRTYELCIDWRGPAYRCSCPVRQSPCKHALALLILAAQEPDAVQPATRPDWCAAWLRQRDAAAQKPKGSVKDPKAQARRAQAREQKVAQGIAELRRFLEDLVRLGLADTAKQPQIWERMERRLIDAQARGLAHQLGWIRRQLHRGEDWADRVLFALARLHLLLSAYEQRDRLEPGLVEEIRAQIGWYRKREAILSKPPVQAHWFVLNQHTRYESGQYSRTVWLCDPQSRRIAQELSFATDFNPDALSQGYQPGTQIQASVYFHSDYLPLRATVVRLEAFSCLPFSPQRLTEIAYPHWEPALRSAQEQRIRLPFLLEWPLLVRDLRPVFKEDRLALADQQGCLVLVEPDYAQRWQLLACTGPEPSHCFLTYDGRFARPWAVWRGDQWFALDLDEVDDGDRF